MDSSPVRRTRAYSVGGSQYDAVNSGNVVRTDKQTGKKTTITGGEMHTALEAGVKARHARAVKLQEQIDLHESGSGLTSHHPMGCAEARAEAAIAAHHFQQPFSVPKVSSKDEDGWSKPKATVEKEKRQAKANALKNHINNAWSNSSDSSYSETRDDSSRIIPPCENCGRRGHTTSGRD